MSTYCFTVDSTEFCKATRTATLAALQEFPFYIQIHPDVIITDLVTEFPCTNGEPYEVHASSSVAVTKYMNSSGRKMSEARCLSVTDREAFNKCYKSLKELPEGSQVTIQAFNNNPDQIFEKIRFTQKTTKGEGSLEPQIDIEEVDGFIEEAEHYTEHNEEAEVMYNPEAPEEILFFSKRVPGHWLVTELKEAGSIPELNKLRGDIEREHAPLIEGDTYIMPKARRGRKKADMATQATEAKPEATETTEPVEEPACKACGDTGKNSKGNPCVCQKAKTPTAAPTPPPPPPEVPKKDEEPKTAPAPEATTKPPLNPSEEGEQETAPKETEEPETSSDTDGGKEEKKPKRRSKEEIRQDKIAKAFKLLTDEQGAEDVVDELEEFCKTILQSRGYSVEKEAPTGEALTLQERLQVLGDDLGALAGKLTQAKDKAQAAAATSEGLTTKEEVLAKLASAL